MVKLTQHIPAKPTSSAEDKSELFCRLFKQHASGIYRLAYAQLRLRVEAQEIVQECFLKLWEKRHEVNPDPTSTKGYLYTSAYHAILNQVRRRHTWVYHDYPENLTAEREPQTFELEYQELNALYTSALAKLPTKRRQIFAMSRQQGLSNLSIARELDISIKTVEAQITHALKFLRSYFRAHGTTLV